MKYLSGLIFVLVIAFVVWPYVHLYQLNEAVKSNNTATLNKLVDFEQVNKVFKETLEWQMNHTVDSPSRLLPAPVREGAQALVGALGDLATQAVTVDANGLLERLRHIEGSLWEQTTFAFFESPTRFTIRLGQLGRNPIHVQMTLQDWFWRVTAIYD